MVAGLIPRLGNDLVAWSLGLNRGKSSDQRFARRVFSPEEQEHIAAAGNPDLALWWLWAAKEACYKAAAQEKSVVVSPLRFTPLRFTIRRDRGLGVDPDGGQWYLASQETPDWVHVWACDVHSALVRVHRRVGPVGTAESVGVRRLATDLLADLGIADARVEGRPPHVWQDDRTVEGRLSLSHDEGYGAVVWLSRDGTGA